jgi:hypothetical protein
MLLILLTSAGRRNQLIECCRDAGRRLRQDVRLMVSVRWSTWLPIYFEPGDSEGCMTFKALAGVATNPRSINSFVSSGTPGSTNESSPKRSASTH